MNDQLLATAIVEDREREVKALLRNRDLLKGVALEEPHYRPPTDPPIPMSLAKEFRQTL